MKDHYLSVIKFPAFVSLSLIIISAIYFGFFFLAYQKPGLSLFETIAYAFLLGLLLLVIALWALTLISTHIKLKVRFIQRLSKWMLLHFYYYLAKGLAYLTFSNKITLMESFLNFNNETVLTDQLNIRNSNILVLLPHCLQKSDCPVRITTDIVNCEECGGCDIAAIKQLVNRHQVEAAVASGGSLARKLIQDKKPDVIVAVACHRDLVEGVRDAWRHPVYAVLNERPNGPCFETTVTTSAIEFAINKFK